MSTIGFTLPISCQICLGKVKQPVVCANQHVFCTGCMDVWLQHNSQCPACRVPITPENPYRPVIGGLSVDGEHKGDEESFGRKELRRARLDIIFNDYEGELERLNGELEQERQLNTVLQGKIGAYESASKAAGGSVTVTDDGAQVIQALKNKLKESTAQQDATKREMRALKKEVETLQDQNIQLRREIDHLKSELVQRSPRRFGRYTVMLLEGKVEASNKEIAQLHRALEKSDEHIEKLERELEQLKRGAVSAAESCATWSGTQLKSSNFLYPPVSTRHVATTNQNCGLEQDACHLEADDVATRTSHYAIVPATATVGCNQVSQGCTSAEGTSLCKKRLQFSSHSDEVASKVLKTVAVESIVQPDHVPEQSEAKTSPGQSSS